MQITETRKYLYALPMYLVCLKDTLMYLFTEMTDGMKVFTNVGDEFGVITKGAAPDRYEECVKQVFGSRTELAVECYGFVTHNHHRDSIPLYTGFKHALLNNESAVRFWGL